MTADEVIESLALKPHPEGGYYVETFRSDLSVASDAHPDARSASTAIYFLLKTGEYSAIHRVRSDEGWHYYAGDPLELFLLRESGVERLLLGNNLSRGERPYAVVPRDVFQAARPFSGPHGFTLCGCTVAPGFDFQDFEMPRQSELLSAMPAHGEVIRFLTRA